MIQILLAIVALSITLLADSHIIRIAADEYCPHNCEEQSKKQGYLIDIASEALKPYGYTIEYIVEKSWKDAIELARSGEYQGIAGTAKYDAPDFIFPKTPIGEFDNCYITHSSNPWQYKGISSLEKQSLGVITDYSYGKDINNYIQEHKNNSNKIRFVSGNNAIKYSLSKVKQGKLDVYVDDCRVLKYHLSKRNDKSSFKIAGKMNQVDDLYIAFSPKNPNSQKYADLLDKGIKQLKQSGRFQKILKQYEIKE